MKFLLDTNVLIAAEPTGPDQVEPGTSIAVDLLRLIGEGGHQPFLHPASPKELGGDQNKQRRTLRRVLIRKYPELPSPPPVPSSLADLLGQPANSSNDHVDNLLLAAVHANAVDYLVTNDLGIIRKAYRASLSSRVLTPEAAVATLRGLFRRVPAPPPAVQQVFAYELEDADEIFDSFRDDYPGFDDWLAKCKRGHRRAWVIRNHPTRLAGVCIIKDEAAGEHGLQGNLLKLCSFKIARDAHGFRFGELLLKAVFNYAFDNPYDYIYVEVLPKYKELNALLEAFGFCELPTRTVRGELRSV